MQMAPMRKWETVMTTFTCNPTTITTTITTANTTANGITANAVNSQECQRQVKSTAKNENSK